MTPTDLINKTQSLTIPLWQFLFSETKRGNFKISGKRSSSSFVKEASANTMAGKRKRDKVVERRRKTAEQREREKEKIQRRAPPNPTKLRKSKEWEELQYFELVMAFVPGFVEDSNKLSKLDRTLLFVIHNLRPARRNGKKLISLTCNDHEYPPDSEVYLLDPDLRENLEKVWPNLDDPSNPEKTWKKQWDIHGRAARISNAIYWPKAAELARPFSKSEDEDCVVTKLNEMGIRTGTKVHFNKFKKALKQIFGADVRVNLREKHGEYYLKEVILLLDKEFGRVPHIDAAVRGDNPKFYFEDIGMRLERESGEGVEVEI